MSEHDLASRFLVDGAALPMRDGPASWPTRAILDAGPPQSSLSFHPPLGLALEVRPAGLDDSASEQAPPSIRGLYATRALDPESVRAVLSPAVAEVILRVARAGGAVRLTDEQVAVDQPTLVGQIEQAADRWLASGRGRTAPAQGPSEREPQPLEVEQLGSLVEAARASVPVPTPLRPVWDELSSVAHDLGLSLERTPIRMCGAQRGVRIAVTVLACLPRPNESVRGSPSGPPPSIRGPWTPEPCARISVALRLPTPLGLGLSVSPAHFATPVWALLPGQRDHRTGHAAFDTAMHVRAVQPERLSSLFDAAVCEHLLQCHRESETLTLDDTQLCWSGAYQGDRLKGFPAAVRAATRAMVRLAENASRATTPGAGPYR